MRTNYFELMKNICFNCLLLSAEIKDKLENKRSAAKSTKSCYLLSNLEKSLLQDFLPPFSREDIFLLCDCLNSLHKKLELIKRRFEIYGKEIKTTAFESYIICINDAFGLFYDAICNLEKRKTQDKIFENMKAVQKLLQAQKPIKSKSFEQMRIDEAILDLFKGFEELRRVIILTVLKNF